MKKKHACPHCGREPRYYGRRELLLLIKGWEKRLSAYETIAQHIVSNDMRRVIDETEKSCIHCNIP